MSVNPSPIGGFAAQFFDNNGVILSGGKIFTYAAGTTTPQATYTSATGVTPHANPIVLDSAGRVPGGEIWLTDSLIYKFVIETATSVLIGTYDNITGVNSNFVNYTVQEEVITATAGQTVFNLTTINYTPGTNSLAVYIDGVNQYVGDSYLETDSDTVTFTAGLHVGAEVKFTTAVQTSPGAVDASNVSYDPPFTGSVPTNVENKLAQYVSVKDFGAVGDGVADDTAAIQAAISGVGAETIIYFPEGTYKVTGTLEMPLKVSGNFTIDGNIKWSFKKEILQEGQVTATGTIDIDSVWFSKFNHLESLGNVTLYSSNPTWGVFWNDFGTIRCVTMVLDVDQGQSVNQNNFAACYCNGGVHIKGTAVAGIREAHNNVWVSVDTTGANLTAADGTTGCHLLNDSNLNQTNTVMNWYAETSGQRLAYGNWNILGDNVDASSPVFMGTRENFRLGARQQGRQVSYLPVVTKNSSIGGDWGELDGVGKPVQLVGSGTIDVVSLASISANASNSPDQSVQGFRSVGDVAFSNFQIQYQLTTSPRVSGAAYVYQEGNPAFSVEVLDGAGAIVSSGGGVLTPLGNNWYLLRFGSQGGTIDVAAGELVGTIRVFSALGTPLTASDFRIITSYFVSTDAVAPLPTIKYGQTVGYSTAAPTGGLWKRGDICWNTTPSAGGTPGWVCVTAGAPGTWKAMANIAV